MVLDYALFRRGPLTMAFAARAVHALRSVARARNIQFHVQPLSLDRFGEPLHEFPAFTASVCNVQLQAAARCGCAPPIPSTSR